MRTAILDAYDGYDVASLNAELSRLPRLRDADWFSCPPGWLAVYVRLLAALDALAERRGLVIQIVDVKEKFGLLSIDATPGLGARRRDWTEMARVIVRHENETAMRCVVCGAEKKGERGVGQRLVRTCRRHGETPPRRLPSLAGPGHISAHRRLRLQAALPAEGSWRPLPSDQHGERWRIDVAQRGCRGAVTVQRDEWGWYASAALLHRDGAPLRLTADALLRREARLVDQANLALILP